MSADSHIQQNNIYCQIEDAIAEILERHGQSSPVFLDDIVEWIDSNYRRLANL